MTKKLITISVPVESFDRVHITLEVDEDSQLLTEDIFCLSELEEEDLKEKIVDLAIEKISSMTGYWLVDEDGELNIE